MKAAQRDLGGFRIFLKSCPNPDHGERFAPKAPLVLTGTLDRILAVGRAYAEGIGGGNWAGGQIQRNDNGTWVDFAKMSYNGRVWAPTMNAEREKALLPHDPTVSVVSPRPTRTLQALALEALRVQDACNLSGVIRGMVRAMDDLRAALPNAGTDVLNQHPIMQAWASKVASLAGVYDRQIKLWTAVNDIAEGK